MRDRPPAFRRPKGFLDVLCPGYVGTPMVRGQLRDLAATRNVEESRVLEDLIDPLVPRRRLLEADEVAA